MKYIHNPPPILFKTLALSVVQLFLVTLPTYSQPGPRPERRHPDYDHDAWITRPQDIVQEFRAYTTSFDGPDDNDFDGDGDTWAVPEWVAYELRRGTDRPEFEPRPSTWHTDAELYQQGIAPRDQSYVNSGYDRGHMCMRNHARRLGKNADWNSHSMLNSVPQVHEFNDGHWVSLEKLCAIWANTYGKVWVICGPIMLTSGGNRRPYEWIGMEEEKRVSVPHYLFKIVIKESDDANRPDVLAFIYENDPSLNDKSLEADHTPFLRSVNEIEELTGLDFLTALPAADQRAIEARRASSLWEIAPEERTFAANGMKALSDEEIQRIDLLYNEESTAGENVQSDSAVNRCSTKQSGSLSFNKCCTHPCRSLKSRSRLFSRRCR